MALCCSNAKVVVLNSSVFAAQNPFVASICVPSLDALMYWRKTATRTEEKDDTMANCYESVDSSDVDEGY